MGTKKIHYCEKLESTINFLPETVKYCCDCSLGLGIDLSRNKVFDKNIFIKTKNKYIEELKNNKIPKNCRDCVSLKEKEIKRTGIINKLFKKNNTEEKESLINHIIINHFKQCDCRCIYCSQEETYAFAKEEYELVSIIEELYKDNLIDKKNLRVEFQGGNVSMLKEFDDLIKTFIKNECTNYTILTNGIKKLEILNDIPQNGAQAYLVISLDSGTKETFKQIKQVDAFEKVLENIKNYNENIKFVLKYIIVNGVNDNKEELYNFLDTARSIKNLHAIVLDIDYRNTFMSKDECAFEVPKHYYELFNDAKEYSEKYNIQLDINPYVEKVLSEGKAYSIIKSSQKD